MNFKDSLTAIIKQLIMYTDKFWKRFCDPDFQKEKKKIFIKQLFEWSSETVH